MPRGTSFYDQAKLQGRLWTPESEAGRFLAWCSTDHEPSRALSGTAVTGWKDRLGKIADFAQATSGARPTFSPQYSMGDIVNRPAFTFDGGDWMLSANSVNQTNDPFLFVTVASFGDGTTTPATNARLGSVIRLNDFGDTLDATCSTLVMRNGSATSVICNRGGVTGNAPSVTAHTPTIFAVQFNGTAGQIGLNGAAITPVTGSFNLFLNQYYIGCGRSGGTDGAIPWRGPIWEFAFCRDTTAYDKMAGYLAHKLWPPGRNPLPASHRYKNVPPLIGL